ncbi:MAG: hypothetical protein P8012_00060 [Desulfobacterales bacterium]
MDIEMLKQITEIIGTIGATSKEAFLWWLIISNLKTYLFGLVWSGISAFLIVKLLKLARDCSHAHVLKLARNCSDAHVLKHACGFTNKNTDGFTSEQLKRACRVLEKYYDEDLRD